MKRLAGPVLLALSALLCSACSPEAPMAPVSPPPSPVVETIVAAPAPQLQQSPPTPAAQVTADITGWWERPDALESLGLSAAEGAAMSVELRKLERSYQTAQRQLRTVRGTQLKMLRDPKVPSADIRRFNQRNLQYLLTAMLDDNITARLWVREHLSADQRARILERSPGFFGERWFRGVREAQPEPETLPLGEDQ